MEKPFFTVFTAVYNGANHLDRVFKSIKDQVFKNFEWIIINDGSTDNTAELINLFIIENPEIRIKYIEQKNYGKHIAWNNGLKVAEGELFVPADADDSFVPETLEFFYNIWNSISVSLKPKISGINVLCYDNDTFNIVGNPYPKDGLLSNNLELIFRYKIKGEKWGCIRTDLLKSRPFKIIEGNWYPEDYIWFNLAKHYSILCLNKPLRSYYTTSGGIMDSSFGSKMPRKVIKVLVNHHFWLLFNYGFYIFRYSPSDFAKILFRLAKYLFLLIFTRS